MSQTQIKTVRWWHESIIELMIMHPDWKNRQIALELKVSEAWLSTVIHSDAFQVVYKERREAHFARASRTVIEKAEALAHVTIDAMTEKIERLPETVPLKELRETSELCMKALGYTARSNEPPIGRQGDTYNTNNIVVASPGALGKARELMQGAQMALDAQKRPSGDNGAESNGALLPAPEKVQAGGSG